MSSTTFYNSTSLVGIGSVGIGTTSPLSALDVASGTITGSVGNTLWRIQPQYVGSGLFPDNLRITNGYDAIAGTGQANYAGVGINLQSYQGGSQIEFYTSATNNAVPTQRAIILASGYVGIGTANPGVGLHCYNSANFTLLLDNGTNSSLFQQSAGSGALFIRTGAGTAGGSAGVYMTSGATVWTANSDIRLKNIISPISNALTKVDLLNPVLYSWKNDETNTPHPGLIAQDVLQVQPETVSVNAEGMYGVGYTELIPLAFAAIKELTAKNSVLEARLAALEAK